MPIVPVAGAALPNGRLLLWSAKERLAYGEDEGRTYTSILDPATGSATLRLVSKTQHDMFCPGISLLADGRVFVTGGSSSEKTSLYDPATDDWVAGPPMRIPRGYQSSVTMPDGSVFTVGGSWSGAIGGKSGEIWSAAGGWSVLPGITLDAYAYTDKEGLYRSDNHAWLFATGGSWIFHAGPGETMHWLNVAAPGSMVPAGRRGDDAYSINGNAVMYDVGRILKVGGAPGYGGEWASANAYVIDLAAGPGVAPTVRKLQPMAYARAMSNAVVLPNGQVVVIGGQTYAEPFSDERAVLVPELWDPATERFTVLAPMKVPRTYHSIALLMTDGRVLAGGGGLCGDCATNHTDVEILTPPYLLNADGSPATRPSIVAAPASAAHGTKITVQTSTDVASFALVRLSSATHTVNTDQRRVPLAAQPISAGHHRLSIPADRGAVTPGVYMLFALSPTGVPSVAHLIRIG